MTTDRHGLPRPIGPTLAVVFALLFLAASAWTAIAAPCSWFGAVSVVAAPARCIRELAQ